MSSWPPSGSGMRSTCAILNFADLPTSVDDGVTTNADDTVNKHVKVMRIENLIVEKQTSEMLAVMSSQSIVCGSVKCVSRTSLYFHKPCADMLNHQW